MRNKADMYDEKFYEVNVVGSLKSAKILLGLVKEHIDFSSVVDIGCGRGTWLKASLALGATRVLGYDGAWNEGKILDDSIEFVPSNLAEINLDNDDELFDLALSLEVAEHLPEQSADGLVDAISRKSNLIVFASAFTRQGGTSHVNEQFPSYWAQKFEDRGYYPVDFFRPKIWGDTSVEACYRQNTFLYIKREDEKLTTIFKDDYLISNLKFMDCMHPEIYLNRCGQDLLTDFWVGTKRIIKSKLNL
jgi:SAM-dependent methyltransferase